MKLYQIIVSFNIVNTSARGSNNIEELKKLKKKNKIIRVRNLAENESFHPDISPPVNHEARTGLLADQSGT